MPLDPQASIHDSVEQIQQVEAEVRIIQADPYFPVGNNITRVLIGAQASPLHVELLSRLVPPTIPLFKTRVAWASFTVEVDEEVRR